MPNDQHSEATLQSKKIENQVGVGSTAGHKIDPFLRSQILQEIIFLTKFGHCS